ncbi:MAG: folate family ECF transporter S component [Oscillospiraceae bacterium]|nr:folate family ECF transporter S component [Oscillospiraceae bacterium]
MQNFKKSSWLGTLSASAQEFKRVSSLTGSAMLAALNVVINQFTLVLVPKILELGFTFIPVAVSAMLYGPLITGGIGACVDIIKYFLRPDGPFFIGFTLNEFLSGFIFGLFLYKKEITVKRVFAAKLTINVVVNIGLTALWLHLMYGKAFWVYASARIIKNLIMLPIETGILYVVLKKIAQVRRKKSF